MSFSVLLLAAGVAFAAPPAKAVRSTPVEEELASKLAALRRDHALETRRAVLGGAEDLRDAVAAESGPAKRLLADRMPGMSPLPFDLCRDLAGCPRAPQSLHVADGELTDDAFMALARPWLKLQEARGKGVKLTVDAGVGVRLELEAMPAMPAVTITAAPTPTGGFDVAVEDGPNAARAYAAARAAVLNENR
ncbi:MAG: hypothetical protein KGL74_03735 [Elusimicrobia bacterium]|nr:hypothetical protein [Elusimicrobiota bacterium]MDE2510212.1 hypothetical protein [Elusimicrobiota bacterium]